MVVPSGNFFSHNGILMPVYDRISAGATSVFCYPMAIREGTNGPEENNPVRYYYDQLDKDGDTVSNALTNTYQTPKSELSGKTFKVADTVMVAGTEKDTVLATFSFPEETETATQALAAPAIALFAAEPVVQETPKSFDATVTVDRSDASKIVFHMEDPCKQVTVSLPCEFKDGTVKLGQTEIPDAKFDGQTVSFQTKKAGTYVIESKTPVQPKPDDAVTGIISGIVASGALQPGASASQFADLTSGSWYYDGVRYALENGLMTGTSARTFAPDRPVTRAMLVTILWRLAGEPYGRVSPFEDVLPGSWYAQAVSWAYDKGIVTGVTATSFQPGAPVTREQLCAILCRYAALTGKKYRCLRVFGRLYRPRAGLRLRGSVRPLGAAGRAPDRRGRRPPRPAQRRDPRAAGRPAAAVLQVSSNIFAPSSAPGLPVGPEPIFPVAKSGRVGYNTGIKYTGGHFYGCKDRKNHHHR